MIRTRSHGQAVDLTGRTSGPWAETARGNWVYASLLTGNSHRDVLGQGSKKNYVSAVQRALDKRGYDVTIDGEYGPETYNAVRQFQSNNGLSVDGKVGQQTRAALFGYRDVLGQGSKKHYAVSAVQRALNKRGYDVTIDGEYGPETYNAVRQFQSNNGLSVDGKVEPQTGAALFG